MKPFLSRQEIVIGVTVTAFILLFVVGVLFNGDDEIRRSFRIF